MTRGRGIPSAIAAAALTLGAAASAIEPPRDRLHAHGDTSAVRVPSPALEAGPGEADEADAGVHGDDHVDAGAEVADAAAAGGPDAAAPPRAAPAPPPPVPLPTGCAADLDALHRALARLRSYDALAELAACEEDRGLVATAARHFEQLAAALPARDGRRPSAAARAAALAPRVPRWRLRRPPAPWPEGATLTLDGKPLPEAELDVESPVDPGSRVIETRVPGVGFWRAELRVVEGGRHDLALAWPPPPPPPPKRPWGSRARRTAVWLDAGLAGFQAESRPGTGEVLTSVRRAGSSNGGATPYLALGALLGASVDVAPREPATVVFEATLPIAYGGYGDGGYGEGYGAAFQLGAFAFGARVAFGPPWLVGSAGVELGLPTWERRSAGAPGAMLFQAGAGELATAYLSGLRVGVPLSVELLRAPFAARVFAAPATLPTTTESRLAVHLLPGGVELAARAPFGLFGGAAAHGLALAAHAREPIGVFGIEPFVGFDNRRFFVRVGLSVPVAASHRWTTIAAYEPLTLVLLRTTVGIEL